MLKKTSFILLAFCLFAAFANAAAAPKGSAVVYADMDAIFEAHPQTQKARAQVRSLAEEKKIEIEDKIAQLEKHEKECALNGDKTAAHECAEDIKAKIAQLSKSIKAEIQALESAKTSEILKDIETHLRKIMEDNKYAVVLDKKQILLGDKKLDITEMVLKSIGAGK
jgi:Skp family chaperone for outer membrane proteins